MGALLLSLADPAAALETVGGKGASLARLCSAGLPVPGGFHVTTAAYRRFVAANGLQPRIAQELAGVNLADPATLEAASRRIGALFAARQIPPEIVEAISAGYAALNDAPVAVRSSATAEDLPGASFAGQQESYLNIRGAAAVLDAVRRCWASLWTARAIAYRLKNQIDQERVALAVVVQELVDAEAAGIIFTANPTNGRRDELLINAAWGLGEAVVSGAVTPDTLTVHKASGRVLRRETAEKVLMTVRTAQGTSDVPVPELKRSREVLTRAQVRALARLGAQIERSYGMPMDVEWALAGGQLFIVQARPITALPPEWALPEPEALFARSSLAEHIASPATPLFATLGLELANQATARLWERFVGRGTQRLLPAAGAYQAVNGYVFLGIRLGARNWPALIRMTLSQLSPMLRGSVPRWQAARQALAVVVEEWERRPLEALPPSELLAGVRAVFGAVCRYYTVVQTTLPAASTSELLFSRLYNHLIRRGDDPPATTFLLGFDTAALRAERSLFELAAWLRAEPELAAYVAQAPVEQLEVDLRREAAPETAPAPAWAAWRQRFQRHLDRLGRTAYEFDFAHPTPHDAPGPLLEAIKAFLSGKAEDPSLRQREAVERREQATWAVLERVGWPRRGWFVKLLRWAQATGPMREDCIFDMGMGHPVLRRMFGELGRRIAAGGAIQQAGDIYWLEQVELEELVAALESGGPLPNFADRIPARKEQWQRLLTVSPPLMLPERSPWLRLVHGGEAERKGGKVVLRGVGTSGGLVTAPARVLFRPEEFGQLKPGEVLVAVTTTPAWTPLFAQAAAVVTDIGGPLSHSSIVAREYGIPAVMAARTATHAIHSGQLVTVDGNAGTVTLEG
jgi:phosphohistidine swiveling domain-containing protein